MAQLLSGRERDINGFKVRRILPTIGRKSVGPFVFFDHMGPSELSPGHSLDVGPHPHINLATVTYLFEGTIEHRDSLGSDQLIEPGAINWMTAGRGIVHSERTPEALRDQKMRMNGIQLWVALPEEHEEVAPSFSHHSKAELPAFKLDGVSGKLLLGQAFGVESPVPVLSDMIYAEFKLNPSQRLKIRSEGRELAVYVADGQITIEGQTADPFTMVAVDGDLEFTATAPSLILILGGRSLGKRYIDWNFVSSKSERIAEVKTEWLKGPRAESERFPPIPGDDKEFTPLPGVR